jgi:hypothetical protein
MNIELIKKWLNTEKTLENLNPGLLKVLNHHAEKWATKDTEYVRQRKEEIDVAIQALKDEKVRINKRGDDITDTKVKGTNLI